MDSTTTYTPEMLAACLATDVEHMWQNQNISIYKHLAQYLMQHCSIKEVDDYYAELCRFFILPTDAHGVDAPTQRPLAYCTLFAIDCITYYVPYKQAMHFALLYYASELSSTTVIQVINNHYKTQKEISHE
jgi:hypothetical protein